MSPAIEKRYDRVNAGTLVTAARAVYGDREMINGWAAGLGCEDCEVIEDAGTDTRVMAASGEGFVIVCFQGTADLRNWLTDLEARRVPFRPGEASGMEVHEGFKAAYESVMSALRERLKRLGKGNIFLTGRSLGGALAMLAAVWWEAQEEMGPIAGMYSFGQPRVGNGAWARWYDARLGEGRFGWYTRRMWWRGCRGC
ncbi:MAG: lipase family protein [Verrucomicrobiota bacterium]|jgi:hypothetical protein